MVDQNVDSNFSSDGQLIQFMYTCKFIRGIFYHSLLNNVPLSLDIEYACIDLMQVSGRVCIDFFGRGEGPQYIYLYTCKPGQPRDYPPHLISPPLQGSVKMPCLPQTIKKYSHDLGPLLAGSILVVEVYGRAADCEDFWVFLQQ